MMLNQNKFRRSVAAFLTGSFALAASSFASVAQEPVADQSANHAQSIKLDDYTSHPLAGSDVVIEIEVKDALNQKGQSRQVTVRLPEYNFTNTMNRALAEMRKTLALDWSKAAEVSIALDNFITEQSDNIKDAKIVDDLQNIQRILARSANVDELDRVVSRDMWQVMMALEDDILPEAEKNLRDIEEALRRAMDEGMNPEDLQKLVDEAQKAMEEFLKEQMEKAQEQSSDQQGENSENSDQQMSDEEKQALEDMQKMLEEMQKMMEELGLTPEQQAEMTQQMMQNMQNMSQAQNSQQRQQSQMSMQQQMQQMQQQMQQMQQAQEMSQELEELIKQQQELMDESADMSDMTDEEFKRIQEQLLEVAKELDRQVDAQTDVESQKDPNDEQVQKNLKTLESDNRFVETQVNSLQEKQDNGQQITPALTEILVKRFTEIQQRLQEMRDKNQQDPQQQQQGQEGQEGQQGDQQQQQQQQQNQQGQPDADNLEQQLQQLMDQLRNMGQRQQDMQNKIQEMIQKMQQMNMHPKDLMDANEHMDNSARDLKGGKPADSIPDQNQAIQSMQSAQQKLQQMMQQMMGAGAPQAGYDGPQEEAPHAPLGRSNPNEIIGIDPADAVNIMRRQRDEIRNQLDQGNLPAEQRQYLERLLNGLAPARPAP